MTYVRGRISRRRAFGLFKFNEFFGFRGCPVFRLYSAFLTSMHPTSPYLPCKTLLAGRFGRFWRCSAGFLIGLCRGLLRWGWPSLLQSMDFIGLLDVRVLEVLDVFLKNGCWMFLKALRSSIRMRSKCCAFGFRFLDRRSGGVVPGIHSFLFSITGRN